MKQAIAFTVLFMATALPATAFAYVGPGAGLSLLGALWALVAAIGAALFLVLAWPIRKMLRKRRAAAQDRRQSGVDAPEMAASPDGRK